jgi:hypothetical protein
MPNTDDDLKSASSFKSDLTTMNKHAPFVWRVNYRNEARAPETILEIAHEKARQILQKNRGAGQ